MTLADLYLQQGLKAEASAVLSQVMKEEPENTEAKSKFAAVAAELDASPAADPTATEPAPPVVMSSAASAPANRTKAEVRERTILSLKAFRERGRARGPSAEGDRAEACLDGFFRGVPRFHRS